MINYEILNINLTEFKNKFYYGQNLVIPNKILDLNENITEQEFFNKLSLDIIYTCDLFINQKLSKVLKELEEKTPEKVEEVIGANAFNNFKMAVYEELKYRLNNNFLPDFANKNYWNNGVLSLANEPRSYTNFSDLLSPKAIAYLRLNDWDFDEPEKGFSEYVIEQIEALAKVLSNQAKIDEQTLNKIKELSSVDLNFNGEIQNLKNLLETNNLTIQSFTEKITNLESQNSTLSTYYREIQTALSNKLDNTNLELINASISKIEQAINANNNSLIEIRSLAENGTLTRQVQQLGEEVEELKTNKATNLKVEELNTKLDNKIADFGNKIDDLNSQVEVFSSAKETIERNLSDLQSSFLEAPTRLEIQQLTETVNTVQSKADDNTNEITSLKSEFNNVKEASTGAIAALMPQITNFTSELQSIYTSINQNENEIQTAKQKISLLENNSNSSNIDDKIAEAKRDVIGQFTRQINSLNYDNEIASLRNDLLDQNTIISLINSRAFNPLNTRIQALESRPAPKPTARITYVKSSTNTVNLNIKDTNNSTSNISYPNVDSSKTLINAILTIQVPNYPSSSYDYGTWSSNQVLRFNIEPSEIRTSSGNGSFDDATQSYTQSLIVKTKSDYYKSILSITVNCESSNLTIRGQARSINDSSQITETMPLKYQWTLKYLEF